MCLGIICVSVIIPVVVSRVGYFHILASNGKLKAFGTGKLFNIVVSKNQRSTYPVVSICGYVVFVDSSGLFLIVFFPISICIIQVLRIFLSGIFDFSFLIVINAMRFLCNGKE